MFKKSLLAVAVLGTAAGFACAADVTLYGKVDTGFAYTHNKSEVTGQDDVKTNTFEMRNGLNSASRFGLKGTEDLGNGLKVGFKLENGFTSDDGAFKTADRLFDREASLSIMGDFGTLSMGRMGGVGSGAGTYSLFTGIADAFDGGNVDTFGLVTTSRYDNMLTYQTPKFAGVQGTFQYSFKGDSKQKANATDVARESSAAADRYASFGLTSDFGALQTVLTYEYLNYASNDGKIRNENAQDGQLISLGGNYDCGFAKTFIAAQYFKDMKDSESIVDVKKAGYTKGYAVALGTIVPVASGDLTAAAYYNDYEVEYGEADAAKEDGDGKYYGLTVKYEYPLSKRTSIYTGAGVAQEKFDYKNNSESKETMYQAFAGLTHNF